MSCGNPHATPCAEVRALVYVYLDGEIDEAHRIEVTAHLQECTPCEGIFARELVIKTRVREAHGAGSAPEALRTRVVAAIQQISIAYRND